MSDAEKIKELLDALQALIGGVDNPNVRITYGNIRRAREAIAKATK